MTQTNYNERLTRLLEAHANWAHRWDKEAPTTYIYGTAKVSDTIDTKSALTQLIKGLVAEANPLNPKGNANAVWAQKPYADGVKAFEQNLLKLLEEG